MTFENRTRVLLDKVRALDERFGRAAGPPYNDGGSQARIITDRPGTWEALVVPRYLTAAVAERAGAQTDTWSLFQLRAYNGLRVTAHCRGDEVKVRYYLPGPWERIFFVVELPDLPALLPGGHAGVFAGSARHL